MAQGTIDPTDSPLDVLTLAKTGGSLLYGAILIGFRKKASGQMTTAIGRMADLRQFDADDAVDTWWKSGRIPGPKDPAVTWTENKGWLEARIRRGDDFILATPRSSLPPRIGGLIAGTPNGYFTARELHYLEEVRKMIVTDLGVSEKQSIQANMLETSNSLASLDEDEYFICRQPLSTMKGHQVVELPSLDSIVSLNNIENGMARSILAWVAFSLSKKASEEDLGMRVDLITVQYISEYPALGIFYFSDVVEKIEDQEEWVIKEGEDMLSKFSLSLFTEFLKAHRLEYISKLNYEVE